MTKCELWCTTTTKVLFYVWQEKAIRKGKTKGYPQIWIRSQFHQHYLRSFFSPVDIHYFKFCIDFRSRVIKVSCKYFLCELVRRVGHNFFRWIECRLMFTGAFALYAKEIVKLTPNFEDWGWGCQKSKWGRLGGSKYRFTSLYGKERGPRKKARIYGRNLHIIKRSDCKTEVRKKGNCQSQIRELTDKNTTANNEDCLYSHEKEGFGFVGLH